MNDQGRVHEIFEQSENERQAMELFSQFFSGENDHESRNPIDDRAFGLLMAIVVIATLAFGIIVHRASI